MSFLPDIEFKVGWVRPVRGEEGGREGERDGQTEGRKDGGVKEA